jgi:hypothetical protein
MQLRFDDFSIRDDISEGGYFSPSIAVSEGYLSPAVAVSEGYFSPSVALAEGWIPEILCIPSPLIHAIPSPMPYFSNGLNQSPLMSSSPQHRLVLEQQHLQQMQQQQQQQQNFSHSNPEMMQKFWASNSGLGLNNPNQTDIQTLSRDPELQVSFESMLVSLGLAPAESLIPEEPLLGGNQQSQQQQQQGSFSSLGLIQPSASSTMSQSAFGKPPAYPRPAQPSSSTETLVDKAESQPSSVCASPSIPVLGGDRRKPFWNLVKSDGRTLYQCPYPDCGKSKSQTVPFSEIENAYISFLSLHSSLQSKKSLPWTYRRTALRV